jgi:hypothetical protein
MTTVSFMTAMPSMPSMPSVNHVRTTSEAHHHVEENRE